MDPKTGMIDINILTTGLSLSDRKRQQEVSRALSDFIRKKGKVPSLPLQKTFEEFRDQSDEVRAFVRWCFGLEIVDEILPQKEF